MKTMRDTKENVQLLLSAVKLCRDAYQRRVTPFTCAVTVGRQMGFITHETLWIKVGRILVEEANENRTI